MSLELAYWKKVAELVYESYADVNFDLLGEDIKVAKKYVRTLCCCRGCSMGLC